MTDTINAFINELIIYDYILFGSVFVIFILLFIMGILARKKTSTSVLLFLLSFVIVILGPTVGYSKMHQVLFKNSVEFKDQKKLTYTKAVVVYGVVKNSSNFDFSMCNIKAGASKVSGNAIKDYLFAFNPFKEMSIIEYDILKGEEREFKLILEPFTYSKDYNISLGASCR